MTSDTSKPKRKKKVLFLCTHNSARSQMAEGLLRALFSDRYEAYSAGITSKAIDPRAIQAMTEVGIDIFSQHSKNMRELQGIRFDTIVTVCDNAREVCPIFPNAKENIHKGFRDPAAADGSDEESLSAFRSVRDELRSWIIQTFG